MKIFQFILLAVLPCFSFAQTNLNVYYGNLHSHTGYSDGVMTPSYAFKYARDTAGIDFLAVTDHLEYLTPEEYTDIQQAAYFYSIPDVFTGIFGFEWSSNVYGHCDVFLSPALPPQNFSDNWSGFTNWLKAAPDVRAQFNHPGRATYYNNWDSLAFLSDSVDDVFTFMEFQNTTQLMVWYEIGLNNGWHLTPAFNQDNHYANWGTMNDNRTGIWSHSLSRTDLFNAIDSSRTFATMDKNASIWIDIDTIPMGGSLERYPNMPLHIVIRDADSEAWPYVQLVTSNGVILTFSSSTDIDTTFNLTLLTDKYIFVRAMQTDGQMINSAPVYLTGTTAVAQEKKEFPFEVFPNPANNNLIIRNFDSNSEYTVEIYSVEGKKMLLNEANLNQNDIIFDIRTLSEGLYFLRIATCNFQYSKTISIVR